MLPYTAEVFFSLFETYNRAIWPAQIVAYGLALVAVALVLRPTKHGGRIVAGIMAAMWAWTGVVFHLQVFAGINFLGPVYGAVFVLEAALLAWTGIVRGTTPGVLGHDVFGWAGLVLAAVALVVHPLVGWLLGTGWPQIPLVGVAPSPTAILTMGLLLLVPGRTPWLLVAIPVLWSLVGGSSAWLLGIWQDLLLLVAGLGGLGLLAWRNRRPAGAMYPSR